MPRRIDLEPYKEEIISRYTGGESLESIANDLPFAHTSIYYRMKSWDVSMRGSTKRAGKYFKYKDIIIERYLAGDTIREISTDLNLSGVTVCAKLREWGIQTRVGGMKEIELEEYREDILYRYARGEPVSRLAKELFVSSATIYNRLNQWSVEDKIKLEEMAWEN